MAYQSLNTFYGIIQEVLVRLGTTTLQATSSFTDTILNQWADDAHRWAADYQFWPFVTRHDAAQAQSSATEIYTYATDYKTDTVNFLQVAGKRLQKLQFTDYQIYREDFPTGQERIWTDYGRLFYINPNLDVTGTIEMWGLYTPASWDATDNTAITVFSNADISGNEAMVNEMLYYAKVREGETASKGKAKSEAQGYHDRAMGILDTLWKRVQSQTFAYQTKNHDMFRRFDVLKGALREDIVKRDQFN